MKCEICKKREASRGLNISFIGIPPGYRKAFAIMRTPLAKICANCSLKKRIYLFFIAIMPVIVAAFIVMIFSVVKIFFNPGLDEVYLNDIIIFKLLPSSLSNWFINLITGCESYKDILIGPLMIFLGYFLFPFFIVWIISSYLALALLTLINTNIKTKVKVIYKQGFLPLWMHFGSRLSKSGF